MKTSVTVTHVEMVENAEMSSEGTDVSVRLKELDVSVKEVSEQSAFKL